MEIKSKKPVIAHLIEAHEIIILHCGLSCRAKYKVDGIPFIYTVEFWSKHAPKQIDADIVSIRIAEDAPMIYVNEFGRPIRDKETGKVLCTRTLTVLCPVAKREGETSIYYKGHDPEVTAQRFINRHLIPCTWGNIDQLVSNIYTLEP